MPAHTVLAALGGGGLTRCHKNRPVADTGDTTPVTSGSLVRFVREYPLDGGSNCAKGFAAKVQDVDVKQGTRAALIEGPDGERYWVPTSVLRLA